MPASSRLGWFRFNPRDLIADPAVQAMTDEQLGKFLRVLCALYMQNSGVATEGEIRAWSRCSSDEWPDVRIALARAFVVKESGEWLQQRVEAEVQAAQSRAMKASESGRAGAAKLWSRMASPKRRDGDPMAHQRHGDG